MDKTVKIRIVRESDLGEFVIGDGSDWKFLKKGLDGFGSISNTIGYTENAISDGGIFTSEHISKVDRTIKCAYTQPRMNDVARRNALSFFNVKDTFRVYITYGERTLWQYGKLYKLACDMGADITARLDLTLTFLFASPFLRSFDDFGKNIASISGQIAFPYMVNKDRGLTGGIYNFAKLVTLYNDGDTETQCRAIIASDGEVINPKLIINEQYVRIIDTMEQGDQITIDFTATPPSVKKNGVNYIGHCDRTSAFDSMGLIRGDNMVKFDADNGSSNMNVTIYYNKLYEAI